MFEVGCWKKRDPSTAVGMTDRGEERSLHCGRDDRIFFGALAGEVGAEVAPGGVGPFDQKDFFLAAPAFKLLFAGDGVANVGEGLEVDEFGRVVLRAEAGEEFVFVLRYAGFEVAGDAGVEDAGGAGHDIDVVNHGR